ncbi:alpha/beta hydrolase [Maribacter sp. ANRC-HE7]|uniref:Alpha/beta hydrolase n=1 Tax=Maribacter aquimaris TaxID=2737171 RepID=A0ABR7V6A8_9FLAO|nr:alpha/beta hydrolase-fold protein [Maribacter aquimaris]MBD0779992.1 alpha/beta hydrolase [Maribacter aquimaris]
MKNILSTFFTLFMISLGNAQIINENEFSIGKTIEINSKILHENRTVNIYLPHGYERDTLKTYPVIYLLDGSVDEDFIHIAGLVQFCSFSWINILPESIVVGIANVDRKRDFTSPSDVEIDQKELPTSGKSDKFIAFIAEELQGVIDEKYRTTNTKTLIGQSLGGLLATEILFERPGLFDNYIIISPSLWWNNEKLLAYDLDKSLKDKSVYIGVGKEGAQMERLAQSLFYKLTLEKKNDIQLFFNHFEGQDHGDVLHLAVYDAFEKLLKKKE